MDKTMKKLAAAIKLWNESRFDLFHISDFDEKRECHGIVRFYHQDTSNNAKYATKCVRVSSSATTVDVVEVLAEKFRSDMRMLSTPYYGLYEVHMNGESRKLSNEEHPLLVQLDWIKDDREGRFLLLHEENVNSVNIESKGLYDDSEDTIKGFKLTRNLTKKEKKYQKKREKLTHKIPEQEVSSSKNTASAAKQLYNQVPESTFTRTVSNPEAVMKKRREQKLQKRGAKVLKIYGDTLNPEIPYKTLLLLPGDATETVIRDALNKYGVGHEDSSKYQLIQVVLPPGSKPEECFDGGWGKETVLGNADLPLTIYDQWQPHQGTLMFQLRKKVLPHSKSMGDIADKDFSTKRPASDITNCQEKKSKVKDLPKFVELIGNKVTVHKIQPNVSEVASRDCFETSTSSLLWNQDNNASVVCVVSNMDDVVTITPHNEANKVYVNGKLIHETKVLDHDDVVNVGKRILLFAEPGFNISDKAAHVRLGKLSNLPPKASANTLDDSKAKFGDRHSKSTSPIGKKIEHDLHVKHQDKASTEYAVPKFAGNNLLSNQNGKTHSSNFLDRIAPDMPEENKLPLSLLLPGSSVEAFFNTLLETNAHNLHFKLSTAYAVYLASRWLHQNFPDHTSVYVNLVTHKIDMIIQRCTSSVTDLAFWMANVSEMLNFMRQDNDLYILTNRAQTDLAKIVQLSFRHIVQCMQRTLFSLMPAFLSRSDDDLPGGIQDVNLKKQRENADGPIMYDILRMLSSAMSLLRKCRVNAALTIQLFSQLFHFINMWLFNKLVSKDGDSRKLCSRKWGICIRARLAIIEAWAEKQGLELAADCHLARITQATHLLQAPKYSSDDIAAISGTCFKLNSLQLRALFTNYSSEDNESMISSDVIERVVSVAEGSADELTRSDGRPIQLMEDPDLQLPFLLPEDGYSCDVVHGVPSGLLDILESLSQKGLCSYIIEKNSNGLWTSFFSYHEMKALSMHSSESATREQATELIKVPIKKINGGMGLSIVAARGVDSSTMGIYIRSVVKGGAADLDGRIQAGDQLISVDGVSLIGVDQEKAANLMTHTGPTAILEVAKQGAVYHGLAMILNHPMAQNKFQSTFHEKKNTITTAPTNPLPISPKMNQNDMSGTENHSSSPKKSTMNSSMEKKEESEAFVNKETSRLLSTTEEHSKEYQSSPADTMCLSLDNPNYSSVNILPHKETTEQSKSSTENFVKTEQLPKPEHNHTKHLRPKKDKSAHATKINNNDAKKFSTLPRHFKSGTTKDRVEWERQEKSIQDELNALRDDEIKQLTDRLDDLTLFERDRLQTLIQEKEFHTKIQQEKMKLYSDEDAVVEDFNDIPDRPDKDRFIQQDEKVLINKGSINRNQDIKSKQTADKFQAPGLEKVDKQVSFPKSVLAKSQSGILGIHQSAPKDKVNFSEIVQNREPLFKEKQLHSDRDIYQTTRSARHRSVEQRRSLHKHARPMSDGYFLASAYANDTSDEKNSSSTEQPVSYVTASAAGVIGSQEVYNDPLHRKQEMRNREYSNKRSMDPSTLTFKDRQRLFQKGGSSPVIKPKSSKTLLRIEKTLHSDTT